ncbi:uncharacterized protein SPSK_07818 [Sporothrix schenckii 1099-18]|uniref:Flavin-nucleotide-binding protein n=2 Tax=Sporothrix schenckii TaxID=29908 RepID=U7PZN2_SPOS1|nr:uncharacterized protein SPSK_07818 [Sporothrix schenckii 1099-18]ERT01109.1 hypothetical protein HMPREF1624_02348 [Sporothrix schenckii ATCC 58251]KJR88241.1 hypothetical protein SPSK_07818 [Sporothrix schenckii 1099-18]
MPRYELTYPKEVHNTVKRYNSRASYALRTIHSLVNEAQLLHVSFQPDNSPFPATLPMIGAMGSFERPSADTGDVLDLYLHGYVSSRLINISRTKTATEEGKESDKDKPPAGLPVTVAASHVDGLVLALSPNAHSYNYRSAVLFGYATLVTDVSEKLYAMEQITNSVVPGRWNQTRVPPNNAEMQSTSVLKVRIVTGSAKIRTGNTHDDRCDLDDKSVLDSVWAGVLPVHTTLGEPIPASYNRVNAVPEYLEQFRTDFNTTSLGKAIEAAEEPAEGTKDTHPGDA